MAKSKPLPKIAYTIHIREPHTHYAEVTLDLENPGKPTLDVQMPVWTPGSYLVREFEKSVESVAGVADDKPVAYTRPDKNTWRFAIGKASRFKVTYKVYAYEFSVRTSFIDASHSLINPSSVCMFVPGFTALTGSLTVIPPKEYGRISTSLEASPDPVQEGGPQTFYFAGYDELADSPLEIGTHTVLEFTAAGVPHEVALVGPNNCDKERLKKDLQKICETMHAIVGEHPCKKYLFIIQNTESGGGGLEHKNSSCVVMNRWAWNNEDRYRSFLGLCAHEYFHLWNVKRIRPAALGPFNYSAENYTSMLWVAEGITSYYDELALLRAGYVNRSQFLRTLEGYINDLENRPGAKVQTVAESSWDAWVKEYRPNENSKNTSISYYAKGLVVAALLDAKISAETGGQKHLDDLMRLLYQRFWKKENRGFTDAEFEKAASEIAGVDLTAFFDRHIRSTAEPMYEAILTKAGLQSTKTEESKNTLGATTALENGRTIVKYIERNSTAWNCGLNVNDEWIAINGVRVNNDADEIVRNLGNPALLTLIVNRGGLIQEIQADRIPVNRVKFSLTPNTSPGAHSNALEKWLGKAEK
ncbi:MAG: M61 family metallopeptidase [Bacteroidetes bacterium]|nr:M61 family metallopeptidase [Bacteroidota bacterium]